MRNSFLTIFTDLLLLMIGFTLFIESVVEIRNIIFIKQKLYKRIFQNHDIFPIEEVSIGRNFCEVGFESFFQNKFGGVDGGSYSKSTKTHSSLRCLAASDCYNIPDIKEQYLNIWEDKVLCLKRKEYKNSKIINNKSTCEPGYRQCAFYNTFGDIFCVQDNDACPINYINITTVDDPRYDVSFFKKEMLTDKVFMLSSRNITNGVMPIDFFVDEGYPCLESNRYSNLVPPFPFVKDFDMYGCNNTEYDHEEGQAEGAFDYRYEILDTYPKGEYYYDNDLNVTYNKLPEILNWKRDSNVEVNLYFRNYISMNLTVLSEAKFKELKGDVTDLKLMKFIQVCVSIVNVCLLVFFVSVLSLVKMVNKGFHTMVGFVKILLNTGFVTYLIITTMQSEKLFEKVEKFVLELVSQKCVEDSCVDMYTVSSIKRSNIIHNITENKFVNKLVFYFTMTYGVLLAIQFVRLCYKSLLRLKNTHRRIDARNQLGSKMFDNKHKLESKQSLLIKPVV